MRTLIGNTILKIFTVKKRVDYKPPRCILPPEIVKKYEEMNLEFWRSEKKFIDYK